MCPGFFDSLALEIGVETVLNKPILPGELAIAIRQALDKV